MKLSVIIPTYNPSLERLNQTLKGLAIQTLPKSDWELIVVDNNSSIKFESLINIPTDVDFQFVIEPRQGLTFARLKGFEEAQGEIVLMVDDDNVLDNDYLKYSVQIFDNNPKLGAIGGNIDSEFETSPSDWTKEFLGKLAIRNLGNQPRISEFNGKMISYYPTFAPVGAGMVIRKEALKKYISDIENQTESISDRKGDSLSSSGDNEIVMYVLKSGFEVGFFPELKLTHLIPANRLTKAYLARLNHGILKSWTLFLIKHNLCPWRTISAWTVPLRKLKSYFIHTAWRNEVNYIHWKGSCGMFEALAK